MTEDLTTPEIASPIDTRTSRGITLVGYLGCIVGALYVGIVFVIYHNGIVGSPEYLAQMLYMFLLWQAGPTLVSMIVMVATGSYSVWGFYLISSSTFGAWAFARFPGDGIEGVVPIVIVPAIQWIGFGILLVVTAVIRARRKGIGLIRFLVFGSNGEWR